METLITRQAPDFEAEAVMPDNTFGKVKLSDYRGRYVVLFFYPLDFTFVCPTEIIAFDEQKEEFRKRGAEIVGVSVDSEYTHLAWKEKPHEEGGIGPIGYPLVSDLDKKITRAYGVLNEEKFALRAWFIIDKKGVVRHTLVNDADVGRNTHEALRTLDAIIFADENQGVCPANWHPGEDTLEPNQQSLAKYLTGKKT
ncbi:MAG: peroxiredoxin [candidate division FCPU426 bacterium]